jgi:hypothetical protein
MSAFSIPNPEVAHARHRFAAAVELRQLVFLIEAATVEKDVDLGNLEPADLELELRRQFQDLGQFERECLAVPGGILRDPIERQSQRPQLGLGQVRQANRRHCGKTQVPGREHQPPAGDNPPLRVDQDRQHEAEPIEARREFAHLVRRVVAGLAAQRPAACDRD